MSDDSTTIDPALRRIYAGLVQAYNEENALAWRFWQEQMRAFNRVNP